VNLSVTSARHKAVVEHAGRRRLIRVALPALAATVVTGSVVGLSLAGDVAAPQPSAMAGADIGAARSGAVITADVRERMKDREQSITRSARRVTIEDKPEPTGHKFSTADLNIRQTPAENAEVVTTVDPATKLAITGEVAKGYAEVIWKKRAYWVSADYLAKKKPEEETVDGGAVTVGGLSSAPCAHGSEIESGITANAVTVLRAVCAEFPMITSYGGYRADGEHADGRAIDIMVSGELGWQVADFLRANSGALGLYDIIYSQRIWTAQRSAEGWRFMSDRGSTTANHYDHVHVKVF
jgi:hypothetical protein